MNDLSQNKFRAGTSKTWFPALLTGSLLIFSVAAKAADEPSAASASTANNSAAEATKTIAPDGLSQGAAEVAKIDIPAGLSRKVINSYIDSSGSVYQLPCSQDIVYMHQWGLPDEVITADDVRHDNRAATSPPAAQNARSG